MQERTFRYLALGDSYTIGTGELTENTYAYQLTRLLQEAGIPAKDPVIIAKDGWSTDELLAAIDQVPVSGPFELLTVLIGVNNQYRGRSVENYQAELSELLQKALVFAGNRKDRVLLLSIPDWSFTPHGEGRNRKQISDEIDIYNTTLQRMGNKMGLRTIFITDSTRKMEKKPDHLAADGLHYSRKEYRIWSKKIYDLLINELLVEFPGYNR